jgi:hypothetical protein
VGNLDVLASHFLDEPLFIAGHRVDRHGNAAGAAAEQVGQGGFFSQALSEKHHASFRMIKINSDSNEFLNIRMAPSPEFVKHSFE